MAQTDKHSLVSVVTPVYNGATYLQECIESVLKQTYTNWDYTVVDNASTDETPEIVARFAKSDSRVRHLRFDDFVGATENHNRAVRAISAESEFCKIVQADDWIYPHCLEQMVEVAQGSETIGIVSAYRIWENHVDLVGLPYWQTFISGRQILAQSLTGGPYVTGAPTALLYRSRCVREREPFFRDEFRHADTEAAYWLMTQHDFGLVHEVLTFARREEGARTAWADDMSTYLPENIRFLLRYGPGVLDRDRFRRQLRFELRKYLRFHIRQVPKPSRLADKRFFAIHRAEIAGILEESRGDPEVRAAMLFVKGLLLRGGRTELSRAVLG